MGVRAVWVVRDARVALGARVTRVAWAAYAEAPGVWANGIWDSME